MIRLLVVNESDIGRISVRELADDEKIRGRQKYYHPDCEIWLVGRDNYDVSYNIMIALQDRHMHAGALWKQKKISG